MNSTLIVIIVWPLGGFMFAKLALRCTNNSVKMERIDEMENGHFSCNHNLSLEYMLCTNTI